MVDLRRRIGLVSQDVFLFHGTVRENITYGTFDAEFDDIVRAAKIAEAHDFIMELPDGYDTIVGERGQKLSGGQRQRISIARAILKDPPVLILDEATSSVDNETEAAIQRSLERITVDRTTIMIAHRLSTIRNADLIYVLENGVVTEKGRHEDLLSHDGLYAALWRVQMGERMRAVGDLSLADPAHDVAQLHFEVGVSGFEFRAADHQRRAEDHDLRAHFQRLDGLIDAQAADRLYRNIDRFQHGRQVVQRAEAVDHVALVEAGMDDDVVDPHLLRFAGAAGFVGAEHDVAHHLAAVAFRHLDLLDDAGIVGLAHDHDHVRAGLEHHLGFQPGAVHRLEIGDDGHIGEVGAEGANTVQPLGQDQRRADFQPVDARPRTDAPRPAPAPRLWW